MPASRENNKDKHQGRRIIVQGRVQGVGFRPFIYRLAHEGFLSGHVLNTSQGVEIELHGSQRELDLFLERLRLRLPPLAEISSLHTEHTSFDPDSSGFCILQSREDGSHSVLISPDIATCPDCLSEIEDPADKRHLYPFTNCTNCGPRLTITSDIPYDRSRTSMACFPMCPACRREYEDPLDRRFHAQPNACPDCGPGIWSCDSRGSILFRGLEAATHVSRNLFRGAIVALKGLGGFHLACAADDPEAVRRLRSRKQRPDKPLAVMAPDMETAARICRVSPRARTWLAGRIRPIVLLPRKPEALTSDLAPETGDLGLMLPYTPLHAILLRLYRNETDPGRIPALVMTSGNKSDEPIALGNREALGALADIADTFLLHNRDILVRCDDSVLRPLPGREAPLFYRRARGFAPEPVPLGREGSCILGLGADSKTTICLSKGKYAFVSQHIGDLQNPQTMSFYEETIRHYQRILDTQPQLLAADLHPDYESTRQAREFPHLPLIRVQHHEAHILSVMAENEFPGSCLGLALDGTGLGHDGTLWGGELLSIDMESRSIHRLAHFLPLPLPGGEKAILEPWRTALSFIHKLELDPENIAWPWLPRYQRAQDMAWEMLQKDINSPQSSSCGRLFDAVSALLGLAREISYEGQAAVRLEAAQDYCENGEYRAPLRTDIRPAVVDTASLFSQVYADWLQGQPPSIISRRFHRGLCRSLAEAVRYFSQETGLVHVALSGGVMQNETMSTLLPKRICQQGLTPLLHTSLPPNDACISLGQTFYARYFT